MSSSDNVVYMKEFLKERSQDLKESRVINTKSCDVESISELRKEIISEERRKVKRTLLTEFVGASVIIPGSGLIKVALNDVSQAGLSFDVLKKYGKLKNGEMVGVRVYLNQTTYFPLSVRVSNIRFIKEENVYRHGAAFVAGTVNEEAVFHFIRFMETVSTSLRADKGDVLLSK